MSVYVGSARIDERGKISGGQAGDQTAKEVSYQPYYLHTKGWYVIRAKDPNARAKIAYAMKAACDNNNIGYDQSNRNGLYNAVKSKGFDPAKCTIKTETDCSATVRVCAIYGTGKQIKDFNTASELSVLKATGLFDVFTDDAHCKSSKNLMNGDILVTRTKGHTVIVISGGINPTSSTAHSSSSTVLKRGSKGENVKTLQKNLNTVINAGLSIDGSFGPACEAAVKNFQIKYGLTVDGSYGPASQAKMQAVLNTAHSSSSTVLKRGSKGENVKTLQKNLNTVINAGLVVDGSFGPACEAAVKNFQRKYGLTVDGSYGPASHAKMKSVLNTRKIATPTLKRGSKGENVKTLQKNLNTVINAGLSIDGSFGPACEAAVKNFQRKYGLTVDGSYGPASYKKMQAAL